MRKFKIAVAGATGLVGSKMIEVLQERNFPVSELIPIASQKSHGKKIMFQGKEWVVVSPEEGVMLKPDIALFSAGGAFSAEWAPIFAEAGCRVIDNSSYWRMDSSKKLIVPEINACAIKKEDMIIANPNCSTIQMVTALAPLHVKYKIKRIVVSTYQSVTGSGQKGINQMLRERCPYSSSAGAVSSSANFSSGVTLSDRELPDAYNYPIDLNVIPHIDSFLEDGYTKEEMKMINETHKIFNDYSIGITATTVRVPVTGGHSESVNVEFEKEFDLAHVRDILSGGPAEGSSAPGVLLVDNPSENLYPMPIYCFGKDEVFVGRLRRDNSVKNGLNMWIVSDNLRKGAATNAVQIAEKIIII